MWLLQIFVMIAVSVGTNYIDMLTFIPESARTFVKDKKTFLGIGVYMLLNFGASNLSYSGAFEVFLNGSKVWSRLATRNMPNIQDLIEKIGQMEIQ